MTTPARTAIIEYVRRELVGPVEGVDEKIRDAPERRYTVGALFPKQAGQDAVLREDVDDDAVGAIRDDTVDDPVALANQWMPSSVGLSLFVDGSNGLTCRVWGARYEREGGGESRSSWKRVEIAAPAAPEVVEFRWTVHGGQLRSDALGGLASIRAQVRPLGGGHLVTLTLVNEQRQDSDAASDSARCLFQVGFACSPIGGAIREYPQSESLTSDLEEAELRLMYRSVRTFAVGHGCAASWDTTALEPSEIRVDFMPVHEIPPLEPVEGDAQILDLARLADTEIGPDALHAELVAFIEAYSGWIDLQDAAVATAGPLAEPAQRIVGRQRRAADRMRAGADLIRSDTTVRRAFQLANRAMRTQMHHSKVVAAEMRQLGDPPAAPVDYREGAYLWFPFQLAVILMTLPSVSSADHTDRDLVDLIWFPTGGGKTEAYLAIAAVEIFLRRLRDGDRGAGTTVITRYTLRLLTSQQFQRAASLTCACEVIRREHSEEMGDLPVSIGLWVGGDATPNHYLDARDRLDAIRDGTTRDGFLQLDRCPWCGTALLPDDRRETDAYGVEATATSFRVFCPSPICAFHDLLPISVVDDQLYESPPTVLLGTVDKFAQLAWSERGGAFFGLDRFAPPSLVIQDELHLISGPLGTTVGIYEAAIEGLLQVAGAKPKIVASTATIRRSGDQVAGVFGRDVALFPPSGTSASDSYFARENPDREGRLFVGVMSQSHTPSTSLIHLAAAVSQAPIELGLAGSALDGYWTQVIYHNSLRELGKTVTYARDDIPARIGVIAADEARMRNLSDDVIVELTSNVPSGQIPGILARLFISEGRRDAISMLLATNMIQVGIDVPRLGLMVVNGQPKSTSEYIQATSRVGRGLSPGLVFTMYSASKPRDRSHYENFLPYHAALYRHVEPTSVTPFALPSRQRALHAALVILTRHGLGLGSNDSAGAITAAVGAAAKAHLLAWVDRVDPAELGATDAHLDRLVAEWLEKAKDAAASGGKLHFQAPRQHRRLLKRFYEAGDAWPTLDSMRSVDRECSLEVEGAIPHG